MKFEDFTRLVAQRTRSTSREELEALVCSEPFLAVYQMIILEAEELQLALVGADLSHEAGRYAATKRQGQVMGMRLAVDRFVQLTQEEENQDGASK